MHEKQFTTEASKKNSSQESNYLYARAYLKKSRVYKKKDTKTNNEIKAKFFSLTPMSASRKETRDSLVDLYSKIYFRPKVTKSD